MNLKTYSIIVTIIALALSLLMTGMTAQMLDLRAAHKAMIRMESAK